MSDEKHDEERPIIKVTDRRLFDAEGNFRADSEEPEATAPEPEAATSETTREAHAPEPPDAVDEPKEVLESHPATEAAPPEAAPPEPVPVPEPQAPEPPDPDASEPSLQQPMAGAAPRAGIPARGADELPHDLAGFVESQYYETLLYLGAIPHPQTGQVVEDLELAQYKIDLLSMLQEKTEGNRSSEESKIFDDVLYQLRMVFLQKRKVTKL